MKKTEVRISENQRELYGVMITPEKEEKYPVVIFSHGYNGSGRDFESMGECLADHGIASFCYDFCGGSANSRSSLSTTDMTIFTEKEDLHSVIKYMKEHGASAALQSDNEKVSLSENCVQHPEKDQAEKYSAVDAENIFLFGCSQGGLVSTLVAEEAKDDIRGMLLLFPAMCIADDWNARFPEEKDIPEIQEFWGMNLGKKFFMTLRGFDVYNNIGNYKRSVQVFYGDKDSIASSDYMEKLKMAYSDIKLEVFQNEGHGFSEEGNRRVTEITLDFIKKNLA